MTEFDPVRIVEVLAAHEVEFVVIGGFRGGAERVAAWVVVLGDRYWITMLSGPTGDFHEMLTAVRPVLATMAFG